MGYYLENQESFPEGIRRIGLELNNAAIDALANDDEAMHEGIHEARRCFKRLRSLFELIRDVTGKSHYREGNDFYRSLARELEGLRDISSLIEAVELLRGHFGEVVRTEAFDSLSALLQEEKDALQKGLAEGNNNVERVIQELQRGRDHFVALPLCENCLDEVLHGLYRQYKAGFRLFQKNLNTPTVQDMHDWRKRVKHLWYMHELLQKAWPKVFKAYLKSFKELGDALGDYHDLALLKEKFKDFGGRFPDDSRRLLHAIAQEQLERLHHHALQLGRRLFAEKPDAFAQRMRNILRSWEIKGLHGKKSRNNTPRLQ